MIQYSGRVQGEYARKYSGFTYRLPIFEPVTLHSLDPDRLDPMNEYPRFMSKPDCIEHRTIDFANYTIKIGERGDDFLSRVELWMIPNQYTMCKESMKVAEFFASNALLLHKTYEKELLKMAFRSAPKGEE